MPRVVSPSVRVAVGLAVLLVALAAFLAVALSVARARCWQPYAPILCRVETIAPLVALTFDDGPTPHGLAVILPELDRRGIKATFFVIGAQMDLHPGLVRQLVANGHEVGNHSIHHRKMISPFSSHYAAEIRAMDAKLRAEGVTDIRLFRPPFGLKTTGLPLALRDTGHLTVMIDVEEDSDATDPRAYADSILKQARPGSIILIHAMYQHRHVARAALPLILDGLAEKGLRPTTVSALMASAQKGN